MAADDPAGRSLTEATVLDRVVTPRGEWVLRQVGRDFEVIANGTFLMDTRDGRSERRLVSAALKRHPAARRLLIGGLGVGFSLIQAVAHPGWDRIVVVEVEPVLLDWHGRYLGSLTGEALADPRVRVLVADVGAVLAQAPRAYDVICLDTDNGPGWTVTDANRHLYAEDGVAAAVAALDEGGVLAYWSAHADAGFRALLARHLTDVQAVDVPSRLPRAEPDVVLLGRRPAGG